MIADHWKVVDKFKKAMVEAGFKPEDVADADKCVFPLCNIYQCMTPEQIEAGEVPESHKGLEGKVEVTPEVSIPEEQFVHLGKEYSRIVDEHIKSYQGVWP